jgi:hypothetical protein
LIIGCSTYQQDNRLDLAMMVGVPGVLASHKQNPVQPKTKSSCQNEHCLPNESWLIVKNALNCNQKTQFYAKDPILSVI